MASAEQKWMNHLVIVRHGDSQRNVGTPAAQAAGRLDYGGDVRDMDVALTACGIRQAEATGKHLGGKFRFDRAFVSPYLRTVQTAQLMLKHCSGPVEVTL
ncbi:MAG: phosphoglycerate mutase family protein, partial [Burkholderiales bacterium]